MKTTKYETLESLRGLAALIVIVHHLPKWHELLTLPFVSNARLMVDLFFVLSGFVIFNAYQSKLVSFKSLIKFQFLRFGRLYPVHFVFLILFCLIELIKVFAMSHGASGMMSRVSSGTNNLYTFIENLFLIHALFPREFTTFNYPSWSISVEFYTYLVFGLITLYINKSKNIVFLFLTVICFVLILTDTTFGFSNILRCICGFFAGCLTANFFAQKKINFYKFTPEVLIVFLLLMMLIDISINVVIIYPLSALLIIALINAENSPLVRVLKNNFLVFLGTISYSIYMSHAFIIWIISQLVKVYYKKLYGISATAIPKLNLQETVFVVMMVYLLVYLVAYICYKFIESPMRAYSRKYADYIV